VFGGKEGVPVTKKQFMLSLSADCNQPGFLDMQDQISHKWFGVWAQYLPKYSMVQNDAKDGVLLFCNFIMARAVDRCFKIPQSD
jgi:hypothetical protein